MRKNLFFVILVLLTCATKTWGQTVVVTGIDVPFSCALKSDGPFIYDGTVKTGAYIDTSVDYYFEDAGGYWIIHGTNCAVFEATSSHFENYTGTNAGTLLQLLM